MQINDQPIHSYRDIDQGRVKYIDQPIEVTVERSTESDKTKKAAENQASEKLKITGRPYSAA